MIGRCIMPSRWWDGTGRRRLIVVGAPMCAPLPILDVGWEVSGGCEGGARTACLLSLRTYAREAAFAQRI